MIQYYPTTCDTGTCSEYYNDYWYRINSTTATGNDYNNWSYISVQAGTTQSPILYNRTYTGTAYDILYIQREKVPENPSEQELIIRREKRAKAEEAAKKALEESTVAEAKARRESCAKNAVRKGYQYKCERCKNM